MSAKKPTFMPAKLDNPAQLLNQLKGLSGEAFDRITNTFDKSAIIIMGVVWVAAVLLVAVCYLTMLQVAQAGRLHEEALAAEPQLPTVSTGKVSPKEMKEYADRLRDLYGKDLEITYVSRSDMLVVQSADPAKFSVWLATLNYLETMAPNVVWKFNRLCVGQECGSGKIMAAELSGQIISIIKPELPQE